MDKNLTIVIKLIFLALLVVSIAKVLTIIWTNHNVFIWWGMAFIGIIGVIAKAGDS